VHLVAPNRSEALALTGVSVMDDASALAAARALLERVEVAIVTRGPDGALIARPGEHYFARGHRVAAIDGGAAGDTFRGAFGAALAQIMDQRGVAFGDLALEDLAGALDLANAAAALCVTRPGAYPSIPERADIDAFMRDHPRAEPP
jgi:ribokinase